jgi:hypothetical protein
VTSPEMTRSDGPPVISWTPSTENGLRSSRVGPQPRGRPHPGLPNTTRLGGWFAGRAVRTTSERDRPMSHSVFPTVEIRDHVGESEAAPASAPSGGRGTRLRSTSATSIPALCAVVGAVVILIAAAHGYGHSPPVSRQVGNVTGALAVPAHHVGGGQESLEPILLPAPIGNARRTQPLQTEWVVDSNLLADPAFARAFGAESPVAIAYLARYSLPGDRLGFSPTDVGLPVGADRTALIARADELPTVVTGLPNEPIVLALPEARRDRAIVIVTADPVAWESVIPNGPIPARVTAGAHNSETRWYVVDIAAGTSSQLADSLAGNQEPQTLAVDPAVRGDLARAFARAFVDATGAVWSSNVG